MEKKEIGKYNNLPSSSYIPNKIIVLYTVLFHGIVLFEYLINIIIKGIVIKDIVKTQSPTYSDPTATSKRMGKFLIQCTSRRESKRF